MSCLGGRRIDLFCTEKQLCSKNTQSPTHVDKAGHFHTITLNLYTCYNLGCFMCIIIY